MENADYTLQDRKKVYAERIRSMTDEELRKEWSGEEERDSIRKIEHEMAMRFMGRSGVRSEERAYFVEKFLQIPEHFKEAFRKKDWFRAKYLYDSAIVAGLFAEIPEQIRIQAFGSRQDDKNPVEGLFHEDMVYQVMKECVMKNRLGFECVVYRIPGEIGFYGAKAWPGARYMPAEENPAFLAV